MPLPSKVLMVTANEDKNTMDIVVADDSLSQAIGRACQNIRLASKITGWSLPLSDNPRPNNQK